MQLLHEVTIGPLTAAEAMRIMSGQTPSPVSVSVFVGAMSVYSAITATNIKAPAEKHLLIHLQYVRELVDRQTLYLDGSILGV